MDGGQTGSYYLAHIPNPVLAQNMPLKVTMAGRLGAVAVALEDAEEGGPGADGFAVLVRHDARDLMDVSEVVRSPGGEELGERDGAEGGVATAQSQLIWLKVEGAKIVEGRGAYAGELVEQLRQGFSFALFDVTSTIEGLEGASLAVF